MKKNSTARRREGMQENKLSQPYTPWNSDNGTHEGDEEDLLFDRQTLKGLQKRWKIREKDSPMVPFL